jgi:hypothetical protein
VSRAIKTNISNSEVLTDPNLKYISSKADSIIKNHIIHRMEDRNQNPERFNVRKTLAERCIQRPVPDPRLNDNLESDSDLYAESIESIRNNKNENSSAPPMTTLSPQETNENDLVDRENTRTQNNSQLDTSQGYKLIRVKQDQFERNILNDPV